MGERVCGKYAALTGLGSLSAGFYKYAALTELWRADAWRSDGFVALHPDRKAQPRRGDIFIATHPKRSAEAP